MVNDAVMKRILRDAINCVEDQVKYVVDRMTHQIREDKLKDEDHITGAFLSLLEENINRGCSYLRHISINMKVFTRREESAWGADFAVILNMQLYGINGYDIVQAKGFLAQAKKCSCVPQGRLKGKIDSKRLKFQCEKMLMYTPSSYIVIYTDDLTCGFKVIPAINVASLSRVWKCRDLQSVSSIKSFSRFFRDFLECYVGDDRLVKEIGLPPDTYGPSIFFDKFGVKYLLYMEMKSKREENRYGFGFGSP